MTLSLINLDPVNNEHDRKSFDQHQDDIEYDEDEVEELEDDEEDIKNLDDVAK